MRWERGGFEDTEKGKRRMECPDKRQEGTLKQSWWRNWNSDLLEQAGLGDTVWFLFVVVKVRLESLGGAETIQCHAQLRGGHQAEGRLGTRRAAGSQAGGKSWSELMGK